jgi:hypothetical protein
LALTNTTSYFLKFSNFWINITFCLFKKKLCTQLCGEYTKWRIKSFQKKLILISLWYSIWLKLDLGHMVECLGCWGLIFLIGAIVTSNVLKFCAAWVYVVYCVDMLEYLLYSLQSIFINKKNILIFFRSKSKH